MAVIQNINTSQVASDKF